MKKELEEALKNVDIVCAGAQLNRNQHAELARNTKLIYDALVEAEQKKKVKEEKKNG